MIGLVRAGRDAELRRTTKGDAVLSFPAAFVYGRKDPNSGERPTQWVDLTLWGRKAEALCEYITKGKQMVVSASEPNVEVYTKKDGTQAHKLCATVDDVQFVGTSPAREEQRKPTHGEMKRPKLEDMDDDIPF
jgi:single-strand DNA-binding protein